MLKFFRNLFFFSVGLTLAAAISASGLLRFGGKDKVVAKDTIAELIPPLFESLEPRVKSQTNVPNNSPTNIQAAKAKASVRARLRNSFSKEERNKILLQAFESSTLESLQPIRTEYLSYLPDYKSSIMPMLKERSLQALREKFSQEDWLEWSVRSASEGESEAKLFVENVSIVNQELGRYLETSAQLFHGMFLSIMNGQRYSLSSDLYYIVHNAETILQERKNLAIPARLLLDVKIGRDELFIQALEELRVRLTVAYMEKYSTDFKGLLYLIEDVKASAYSEEFYDSLKRMLRRLVLDASTGVRNSLKDSVISSKVLAQASEQNEEVRKALAEYFVLVGVDAIERGDSEAAENLLETSQKMYGGLTSQQVVRSFLNKAEESKAVEESEAATSNERSSKKKSADGKSEEKSGSRFFERRDEFEKGLENKLDKMIDKGAEAAARGIGQIVMIGFFLILLVVIVGKFLFTYLYRRNEEHDDIGFSDDDIGGNDDSAESLSTSQSDREEIEFDDLDEMFENDLMSS